MMPCNFVNGTQTFNKTRKQMWRLFSFALKMSTFVNEQVKRLNTSLTQSFEKHLANTASLSSLGNKDKFLLETSQSLDLTSSTLPSFEKVQEYLEKYNEFKDTGSVNATAEVADPALEWLFVAKCTIAIYGQVFSKVLNLTLPISESIDYWNSIQGSTINEIYYAMQSNVYLMKAAYRILIIYF